MIYYKKGALIYIEPYYNDKFNQAIVDNYHLITDTFNHIDFPFIYLPKLFTDSHINKVLQYNHPHLNVSHGIHPEKLYHIITHSLGLKIDAPTLVYLSDDGNEPPQFELPSHEVFTSPERLMFFVAGIRNKIRPLLKDSSEDIRFRRASSSIRHSFDVSFDDSFDSILDDSGTTLREEKLQRKSYKLDPKKITADDLFEEQAFKIPHDLQKQIETLSEAGYLSHLIKYLEILQQATRRLSRLKISKDYKIWLMDYDTKEVEMSPLPKALYFLFLNHPEGISFKELPDYYPELMTIYKNISLRESPDKARRSIKKLTDPFDNSVHEKCSRIRAAFLTVIADDIAENYYITGDWGEAKKILLDRELVIYEK